MEYDIVIIGASSAGLYAAELLAKHGKQVILFERAAHLNPGRRTYIITPGLYRVMPYFPDELVCHRTNIIKVKVKDKHRDIPLSSPDIVIERSQLLSTLLNRARNAGAIINFEAEFVGLQTNNKGTLVKIQSGDKLQLVQTRYLIGADGILSSVGIAAGLSLPRSVPLIQAEIYLPQDYDSNITSVWFDIESTPYFYWLIPEGEEKGVIGMIAENGDNIREMIDHYLEKFNMVPLSYQAGQAALHTPGQKLQACIGDLRILLVGDAAGQVKVTTVGGTVTGLNSARAAVEAIIKHRDYHKALSSVSRELDIHFLIRKLLNRMSQRDYEYLLELITPRIQAFLSRNHRDAMSRQFWKMPLIQPRFIPFGIRLLFRNR